MIRTVVHYVDFNTCGGCEEVVLLLLSGLDKTRWRPILVHHEAPGIVKFVNDSRRARDILPRIAGHDRPKPLRHASSLGRGCCGLQNPHYSTRT